MNFQDYLKKNESDLFRNGGSVVSKKTALTALLEEKYKNMVLEKEAKLMPGEILIEANNLEEGLEIASGKLGVEIHKLQYRVLESGTAGVFGLGSKPFRFAITKYREKNAAGDLSADLSADWDLDGDYNPDRDGLAEIDINRQGKYLLIHAPRGNGKPADLTAVKKALLEKNITDVDENIIRVLMKKKDGKPFQIGDYVPSLRNDGKALFEMSPDRMKGYVRLIAPKLDGRNPDIEDVREVLRENRISFGIDEEKVENAIQRKVFNLPILVAEGRPVKHGRDARIDYKHNYTDKIDYEKVQNDSGQIDFREIFNIVNVMVDEVLAEKILPETGENGINLLGQVMPARSGKDTELRGGENTRLSEDGRFLKAAVNGHAIVYKKLLTVKPVYEVRGDVGPATGNITNMGSVIVHGSVLDGYNIEAAGNIEVKNSVGSCSLQATGDILIKLGVSGKRKGKIISKNGNIFSKFIQDAYVEAGYDVIVTESIMHSEVNSEGSVILNGKKAAIMGGVVRAVKEVTAKSLGASSNIKTTIEVGVLPGIRIAITELQEKIEENDPKETKLKVDIQTMESQKLDEEKQAKLEEMKTELEALQTDLEAWKNDLIEKENDLQTSEIKGKVTSMKQMYRGVILRCNTGVLENNRDQNPAYYQVDENTPDYVKLTPIKSTRRR